MYTVATYLVEVKAKQTFAEFLRHRIFGPLSMKSTSLQPEEARNNGFGDRIATGYCWNKAESTYHGFQSSDCEEGQGAGSIVTSVNDFSKWVKALMNQENPINERLYKGLVRGRTLKNPNARRLKPYSSPAVYAAGVEVHYYRGTMVVGHDGMVTGFASRFFFLPDFKFGAVIFANSSDAGPVTSILARELMDQVLQVPEIERPRRSFKKTAHTTYGSAFTRGRALVESSVDQSSVQATGIKDRNDANKNKTRSGGKLQQKPEQRDKNVQAQKTPLDAYTGDYSHPGYHIMVVQVKDGRLFIDATDRSMGFTLLFQHNRDQKKYIAHLSDVREGGDDELEAEFVFENDQAVKMGLWLEPAMKEFIWFKKVR